MRRNLEQVSRLIKLDWIIPLETCLNARLNAEPVSTSAGSASEWSSVIGHSGKRRILTMPSNVIDSGGIFISKPHLSPNDAFRRSRFYPSDSSKNPVIKFDQGTKSTYQYIWKSADNTYKTIEQLNLLEHREYIEAEFRDNAAKSVAESVNFIHRYRPGLPPTVDISDEGMVTLEWNNRSAGLMLVFSGDGIASYATKDSNGFYGPAITEFLLSNGLPVDLETAIEGFLASRKRS